jgi:transposase-like protein
VVRSLDREVARFHEAAIADDVLYSAPGRRVPARQIGGRRARRWRQKAPGAVTCLERDIDSLLSFLDCPPEHRRMVRTTNAIERCFRAVRRRTRPMTCFNNNASCERIIYAVFSHLNHNWKGRALPQFTHGS